MRHGLIKYERLCDTSYRSDEGLCDRRHCWFDHSVPDKPKGFAPRREFSDDSFPRLGWVRFILNRELCIKNIHSGAKSFSIMKS
jgi:hypothetical protein